jgi:hypothetical protein
LPEYFLLGEVTRSDGEITSWLQRELASWQFHAECSGKPADSDRNDVDATSTADEGPHEVRNKIDDALKVFYEGLPYDITTRTIRVIKRKPSK